MCIFYENGQRTQDKNNKRIIKEQQQQQHNRLKQVDETAHISKTFNEKVRKLYTRSLNNPTLLF